MLSYFERLSVIHGHGGGYRGNVPPHEHFRAKVPPLKGHCSRSLCTPPGKAVYPGYKKIFPAGGTEKFFCPIFLKFVPEEQIFCPKFFLVYPGYSFFCPDFFGVPGVQLFFAQNIRCTRGTEFFLQIFGHFLAIFGQKLGNFFHLYHGYTFFKKNFLICTRGTVPLVICTHLFSICTRGTVPFVICTHLFSNCTRGTFQALFPPKILPGERSPGKILPQNFWVYPGYSSPPGQNTVPTYASNGFFI